MHARLRDEVQSPPEEARRHYRPLRGNCGLALAAPGTPEKFASRDAVHGSTNRLFLGASDDITFRMKRSPFRAAVAACCSVLVASPAAACPRDGEDHGSVAFGYGPQRFVPFAHPLSAQARDGLRAAPPAGEERENVSPRGGETGPPGGSVGAQGDNPRARMAMRSDSLRAEP